MTAIELGALRGFTIVTPDLEAAMRAYGDYLDYRGDGPALVGAERAAAWGAPQAAGARMTELRPAHGPARFLRLVEGEANGFAPYRTAGWAAAEILVGDLDAVAARLANGPFRVIGAPAVLDFDFTDQIRAMQVVGPGGEVLYLTEIGAEIPGFDLPRADGLVCAPFIAVLGGPSLDALADGYAALARPAGPVFEARIDVLSDAYRLPTATRHRLSTVALPDTSLIELDQFPSGCAPRPLTALGLPGGIAMVSFDAKQNGSAIAEPLIVHGAAGEWIELLPPADLQP
jgi:hypothetical protein